ncbi:hypothetical protein CEXT_617461 [Caerostris extrusa]|uniref:Uncharacterized protein n=1 Tax=Caerostris extrusa TaxID=172846 RepID=A0AAV4QTJ2_CAEEX|nr:hypothetical protein CEXT_617461 [Caerostris extrusa]
MQQAIYWRQQQGNAEDTGARFNILLIVNALIGFVWARFQENVATTSGVNNYYTVKEFQLTHPLRKTEDDFLTAANNNPRDINDQTLQHVETPHKSGPLQEFPKDEQKCNKQFTGDNNKEIRGHC